MTTTDRTQTTTDDAATQRPEGARRAPAAAQRAEPPEPGRRGPDGLLLDPEAARAEARRGWFMLTALFVGGAILVAIAAMAT